MRIVVYAIVVIVVIALVGAAFVAFGFSGDGVPGGPTAEVTDPMEIDALAVAFVQNPYTDTYEITRIAGYVQNLGETTIAKASLEIQLLGRDDSRQELVVYEVLDIPPGSRKSFDANAGSIDGPRTAGVTIASLLIAE